ncbi:MAG: hypothetical protein IJY18_01495 [Clostridia bacterium]|nr:hypothetical protein [Clostridia bacterium]
MKPYIISFFGHRDFYEHNKIEALLYPILKDLIDNKEWVEIYIGRNGEFDVFVASIIKRIKKRFDYCNCELSLVLPYNVKDVEFYEKYYDSVFIPESIEKAYPKAAIAKRNEWMVSECDLCICYVNCDKGGAFKALEFAEKLGKRVINLAEL